MRVSALCNPSPQSHLGFTHWASAPSLFLIRRSRTVETKQRCLWSQRMLQDESCGAGEHHAFLLRGSPTYITRVRSISRPRTGYVDICKGPLWPFVVHVQAQSASALGFCPGRVARGHFWTDKHKLRHAGPNVRAVFWTCEDAPRHTESSAGANFGPSHLDDSEGRAISDRSMPCSGLGNHVKQSSSGPTAATYNAQG